MWIVAFLVSLTLSLGFVPIIRWSSLRKEIIAEPRVDRWHKKSTPKIGGVGIFFGWGITILILYSFHSPDQPNYALIAGASILFILGLIDDFKRISPPAKLIGEIIASAIVVFFGRNIDFFSVEIINILVTFFWLVGITNAINLLDNMDGLAGGVSFISACLLGVLFWRSGNQDLLMITLCLAGSILGFMVFNFPPASIFMGDSGSLFLGFTLSALAIARIPQASNLLAVMGVPTMLFLLPILDTSLVTITRLLRGQSPVQGGKDHTSHRLIAFGLSERQAVLILYGVALLSGILGIVIESINYTISLIIIPVLLVTLALLTSYLGRLKVIPPGISTSGQRSFSSFIINLTYRGRILEITLDLFLISISYYLAYWIHFGSLVDILNKDIFLSSLPIALAGSYISFFIFGLYRGVWQYLDSSDLLRYLKAALGAVLLTSSAMAILYYPLDISYRIFIIFALLLILGLLITRSSFAILDRFTTSHLHEQEKETPVLIYNAEEAGILLLQWLSQNINHHMNPIGFLDDDPYKTGRQILGLSVLGTPDHIGEIRKNTKFEGILLASDRLIIGESLEKLLSICDELGIWVKTLKLYFDLLE